MYLLYRRAHWGGYRYATHSVNGGKVTDSRTPLRAIPSAIFAAALLVTGAQPASALIIESGTTTSAAHFNPIQGCWVYYFGSKSTDRATAYDEYDTCITDVGARLYYQPNAPVGVQVTAIKFATNYASTQSIDDFRKATGSTRL